MAHCFTPIRGRRMRVTKVNALGRPVYGPASFVTTSGFVSVQFSPEIEEGEETTVKTASGEICVSEKACDELKWISVQMEFCQVDPCLFTLINETWTELRDCVGDVIGWAESHKFSCDSGFALELWTDVTGYTPTTPGATGAWGYMLLPFIVGGTLGEQTVENGAVSFQITGRTKKGSAWGVGPYDVMCNDPVTGACGPLLTPVGSEEPRRIFLTTCPPPPAVCGCQPLSSPDGPPATVAEDTSATAPPGRMGVTASIPAGTVGTYRVDWGDGTPAQDLTPGTPLDHTYARAGTYNVAVWDTTNTQKITVHTVKVPFTGAVIPTISIAEEAPAAAPHKTVRVTVTNPAAGRSYEVQWEAGAAWTPLPTTGTTPHSAAHEYTTADGEKVVTVRDIGEPDKSVSQTITIPWPQVVAPVLLATEEGGDATRRTTRVTVTNPQPSTTYEISWDNGATFAALPTTGSPAHSATKQQATGATQSIVVRQVGTPTNSTPVNVPLPHPGPQFTIAKGTTDTEATVTVVNPGTATYEVEWVSGSWVALATNASHTYTAGTHQVRVRDQATPAVMAAQQVTVPFPAGFAAESAVADTTDTADGSTARKRAK
jgi:hypothetical protein